MRSSMMFLTVAALSAPLAASPLTVISFGGLNKTAQQTAFYTPFEKLQSTHVVAGEYNGEMAKLKAMVETRSVNWDVVEVESAELERGCEEGLFERLDHTKLGSAEQYIDGALSECGVGIFIWSTAIGYNAKALSGTPENWKDFWDVQRFPGKRALRKGAKVTLEIALLADGVAPADLTSVLSSKLGVDRAFNKLNELKPYIQWWEAGAQPMQWLASGDVVMTSAYTARTIGARKTGYDFQVVWQDSLYDMDSWAIVKGSKNVEQANRFIEFASTPVPQKDFAEIMHNGPVSKAALSQIANDMQADLPTSPANLAKAHRVDTSFWIDNGEELEQRFNAWASQ